MCNCNIGKTTKYVTYNEGKETKIKQEFTCPTCKEKETIERR